MLQKIVRQSAGRIDIIAASGIVPENASQIIETTGVNEIHGSCKKTINGLSTTDVKEVKELLEITKY